MKHCNFDVPVAWYLLLGLIAGCGPSAPKREFGDVTGKVAYKGAPLKMGKITFQPPFGSSTVAEIQSDGSYNLKAVVGANVVMIVSREEPKEEPKTDKPNKPTGKEQPPKNLIPPEYGTPGGKLTFEVKAGANKADFDLK